jgi:endonuclease G, mitochondrial
MSPYRKNDSSSTSFIRVGLFVAIISGLFTFYNTFMSGKTVTPTLPPIQTTDQTSKIQDFPDVTDDADTDPEEDFLPTSTYGEIVKHRYYTLSYSENDEQAEWVAYVLTKARLEKPWVQRPDQFQADPKVSTGSAQWFDYKGSGYDRGHLASAADMSFNETAMNESFYMSNMSPQARDFNKGIWKELEELARDWAKKNKKLYVVSGPILSDGGKGKIAKKNITIPNAYYKILLDITEPELKAIAFIVPNEVSYDPLFKYAVSIDEVETKTGIDFFPNLLSKSEQKELEGQFNIDLWPFSKKKFDLRVNQWNKD